MQNENLAQRSCGAYDTGALTAEPVVTADLRILATSDVHVHIAPHDYYTDRPSNRMGLAKTAALINEARSEVANSVLFDNGDFLQGSAFGDFLTQSGTGPSPIVHVMNNIGYDAANLGNHEFSSGLPMLLEALRISRFPVLSGNVFVQNSSTPLAMPRVLLPRMIKGHDGSFHPICIGVTGALPPQTAHWDQEAIAGQVWIDDMVSSVARNVQALKREGADIVVVLAHCGIGPPLPEPMAENAGLAISRLSGIDALVLGHTHEPFPNSFNPRTNEIDPCKGLLNGVPAVLPGMYGSHLGVIDLQLQLASDDWSVCKRNASLRSISARDDAGALRSLVRPDLAVLNQIWTLHEDARRWTRQPIAFSEQSFHSFFAMVADVPAMRLIHEAQIAHVRKQLSNRRSLDLPILSATAPFKAGGRAGPENFAFVPAGEVLMRHAAEMYLYPNTLVAIRITGASLRGWLEKSARVFLTVSRGDQDQRLLDPNIPSFQFDTFYGVEYEIDLTAPASTSSPEGGKIRNLTWQGDPVRDDQIFILATNSYRASGSGGFISVQPDDIILADGTSSRDVLINYLQSGWTWPAPFRPNWRLTAPSGTSGVFQTSPAAADYLSDVPELSLRPLGLDPLGFLTMRLTL